jgi:MinD-like ATPase involved in chromosome partitioning or flagellar assembly
MGDKVYETVIPRNVRVSEAPSHGKPVLLYDLKCSGSQAYLKLASEVIQRERGNGVAAGGEGTDGRDNTSGFLRAKAKVVVCGPLEQTEF